jgi:protein phosphatase
MLPEKIESTLQGEQSAQSSTIPAAITDTGCERDLNEDRYAVIECDSGIAWIVCDGMGGAAGGELAAQLAIDAMRRHLESSPERIPESAMKAAVQEANRVIVLRRQNLAFSQMGTTIVAALFNGPEVVLAHVGDSRAYLVRDGAIQHLTTDHTFVQDLVDKGHIKSEEALSHPQAHILTRCIGSEPGLEVDLLKFWIWSEPEVEPSDYLLLCTDGLYSMVSEGDIADIVSQNSPQKACVKLVELAKTRGGFDNITLAVIPLGGQLRQERPADFEQYRKKKKDARKKKESRPINPVRLLMIVSTFSVLAVLITIFMMAIYLTR